MKQLESLTDALIAARSEPDNARRAALISTLQRRIEEVSVATFSERPTITVRIPKAA